MTQPTAAAADGNRQCGRAGKAIVQRFEDCKLRSYPDPKTKGPPWTVGWGATGPGIGPNTVWTQPQADARLASDLTSTAQGLNALLGGATTTQNQFDALCSFAFNVGLYGTAQRPKLRESTLLRKHKAGDFAGAALEFGKWINKGSPVEDGLRNRRAAEAALYRGV